MSTRKSIALLVSFISLLTISVAPAGAQQLVSTQIFFDNVDVDTIGGPRQVVLSPDSHFAYVASENDNAIAIFSRDTSSGDLTYVANVVDPVNLFGCASIAMPVNGQHLYATAAFGSAISVFERDHATGLLTYVTTYFNNTGGVSGIGASVWSAVSPEGRHVYVAGSADSSIATFKRNRQTGELTFVGKATGIPGVFEFVISQDGKNVYAASRLANAIAGYSRDKDTGLLTLIDVELEGIDGVQGLRTPRSVTISHDGNTVYTAGLLSNAVSAFSRDPATGLLTYQQTISAVSSGLLSLLRATNVTVSRNGAKVYVAGFAGDAITVFDRDQATGLLTFAGLVEDPLTPDLPLDGLIGTAVSRDGHNLYAVGFLAETVLSFDAQKN